MVAMNFRSLCIGLVFVAGCAVGGASARFVVPPANAQQAAMLTRWDYKCFQENRADDVQPKAKEAGADGWEMTGVPSESTVSVWCFKRPKM